MNSNRQFYLIRHGKTRYNGGDGKPDRVRGVKNVQLTWEGVREAEDLAERLQNSGLQVLISSPLDRAHDTAKAIAAKCNAVIMLDKALLPWDMGEFTGQETSKVHDQIVSFALRPDRTIPGGESFNTFKRRIFGAVNYWLTLGLRSNGPPFGMVVHRSIERLLTSWLAAKQPHDLSLDMDVYFQSGEEPAHAERVMINSLTLATAMRDVI